MVKVSTITVKVGNQAGQTRQDRHGTYAIKNLFNAEGYDWKSQEKVWCRTYPVEDFSVKNYFDNAHWTTQAVGIEVRFYDDSDEMLAKYLVDRGQCVAVINNIPKID